jgi:hypothetical protein
MDEAVGVAAATLEELFNQGDMIHNITNNIEIINDNLSISERIMKSMKSLFYRFTYSREAPPNINDPEPEPRPRHDERIFGKLKEINIAIGSELSRQNIELYNISEKIIDSDVKLTRLDKSF